MGSVNCCKKPEEVEISGKQYNTEVNADQVNPLEKDNSYPHDSEQIFKNSGKADLNAISNQIIYNDQAQTSKEGNAYELQVDAQNPNENQQNGEMENNEQNAEEAHNLQNSYGERGNEEGFVEDSKYEQQENSPKVEDTNQEQVENQGQEEEQGEEIEQDAEQEQEQEPEQEVEQEQEGGQEEIEREPEQEEVEQEVEQEQDQKIEEVQESNIVQPQSFDQEEQYNALNDFGDTLGGTIYENAAASSGVNAQVQSFQNAEDTNKYFSEVGNSNTISLIQNNNSQLINSGVANNLQYVSTTAINGSQINPNEDINKYFQQNVNAGTNIDLNNLGTLSTVPAPTTGNDDYSKYFQDIPNSSTTNYNIIGTSSVPAPPGNEDINKYFQNNENSTTPGFSSGVIAGTSSSIPAPTGVDDINTYLNNNINLEQTVATGTFDLHHVQTTSSSGIVDLSQLGVNANASTANENVDLSQYGLGIASAVQPQSNDNDINKYFQQNTSSASMAGNFDLNNLNNPEYQSMALPNIGNYNLGAESQITFGGNNFNSYELKQNHVTTKKVESSYVSPVQSYSYNYSYTQPVSSQVTK